MTKNRTLNRRQRGRNYSINKTLLSFTVNVVLTSGVGQFTIGSGALTTSARFVAMQDCFRFYRVMKMSVQPFYKEGTAAGTVLVTAWEPGSSYTTITAFSACEYDCMIGQYISGGSLANEYRGSNPPVLHVSRKHCIGLQPWYLTDGDGSAENDTIGTFRFVSDSGSDDGTAKCICRIWVEFKEAADPAVISETKKANKQKLRDQLELQLREELTQANLSIQKSLTTDSERTDAVVTIGGQKYLKI